jgi:hypothetical protein
MAATANSIKKAMRLVEQDDGTLDMTIHVQVRPNRLAYVDGRPCGDFAASPATAAQGVTETVVATVTELVKAADKPGRPGVGRNYAAEIDYRNKFGDKHKGDYPTADAAVLAGVRQWLALARPGTEMSDDEIYEVIGWTCTVKGATRKMRDWLAAR